MKSLFPADAQWTPRATLTKRMVAICVCVLSRVPCGGTTDSANVAVTISPQTLESVVSEQVRLELDLKQEELSWQQQRDHIEALLTLRKVEKERLEKNISELLLREKTGQDERERLTRENNEARQLMIATEATADLIVKDLLTVYDNLPEPLLLKMKPGLQTIRTRLKKITSPEQTAERLRNISAFGADLQRTLSETHAVKQIIALGKEQRIEVEALYLGGLLGFYLTPDHRHAGLLSHTEKGWSAEPDNKITRQVARALAIKRKEAPPTLVRLPLQLPTGQGVHQP